MDAIELSDVIARAQARDPSAFDELIECYGPRLFGYFYRVTGRRAEAEDLLQDLFVRLVGMLGQYQHDGRFEPWLFRIATNLVRDRIRRLRAARELGRPTSLDGQNDDCGVVAVQPADPRPLDRLETAEELDRLGRAIQALPEPERVVVLLRHFSQMPFREIADLMGTPLGTALARAHRGLARLRDLLEADEEFTTRRD